MYYQLNIDYIIETYCVNKDKPQLQCNGKCHLSKQLQITNNDALDADLVFNVVYEAFYPVFFQNYQQFQLKYQTVIIKKLNVRYTSNFEDSYSFNYFQPPESLQSI